MKRINILIFIKLQLLAHSKNHIDLCSPEYEESEDYKCHVPEFSAHEFSARDFSAHDFSAHDFSVHAFSKSVLSMEPGRGHGQWLQNVSSMPQ